MFCMPEMKVSTPKQQRTRPTGRPGRPFRYGEETKIMRVSVAFKEVIEEVIRTWAEDPDGREIVCVDR